MALRAPDRLCTYTAPAETSTGSEPEAGTYSACPLAFFTVRSLWATDSRDSSSPS